MEIVLKRPVDSETGLINDVRVFNIVIQIGGAINCTYEKRYYKKDGTLHSTAKVESINLRTGGPVGEEDKKSKELEKELTSFLDSVSGLFTKFIDTKIA